MAHVPMPCLPNGRYSQLGIVIFLPGLLILSLGSGVLSGRRSHPVQLGARGGNLLNTQLAQLRLELTQGLGEILAVLRPQLAGLDLAARLRHCQLFWTFSIDNRSGKGFVARLIDCCRPRAVGNRPLKTVHVKDTDSTSACNKKSIGFEMATHHGRRCMSSRNCLLGRRFVIGCWRDGEAGEDCWVVEFGTKV